VSRTGSRTLNRVQNRLRLTMEIMHNMASFTACTLQLILSHRAEVTNVACKSASACMCRSACHDMCVCVCVCVCVGLRVMCVWRIGMQHKILAEGYESDRTFQKLDTRLYNKTLTRIENICTTNIILTNYKN
jgi:hypothetical protein